MTDGVYFFTAFKTLKTRGKREKENNLVRYRIPTSTDDSSKRSEQKSNKSDQKRAKCTTSDVVNKIKRQSYSLS